VTATSPKAAAEDATPAGVRRPIVPTSSQPALPDDPNDVLAEILVPETRGELYPLYHRLRELAPVWKTDVVGLPPGTWALSSFAAVDRVARSASAVNDPRTVRVFDHDGKSGPFYRMLADSMLFLEKPAHDRIRRVVFRAFTPRSVAAFEAMTTEVANDLIDAVVGDGAMDFVRSFSYPLPIRAICRLLGMPPEAQADVERWAWDFARAGDPMTLTPEIGARGDEAALAFRSLFEELLTERRRHPRDDVMTLLVHADEDGERLSLDEAIGTCVLLLQAGHETTADLLGNGLVGLFRHRDQLEWLRANPDATREAVEELLRYDCSVQMSMRLVTTDLEVEGSVIPRGSLAALFYGAANRDPARFEEPDRLDLRREPQHLAFSAGAYYCLGNALARLELRAGLRTLLERLPNVEPAAETFVQRRTMRLRGPQELRVRWSARRQPTVSVPPKASSSGLHT
jgi:cytochrome P450